MSCNDVLCIVRQTFIEFRSIDEDVEDRHQLRRTKSEPHLMKMWSSVGASKLTCDALSSCIKATSKRTGADTPSTMCDCEKELPGINDPVTAWKSVPENFDQEARNRSTSTTLQDGSTSTTFSDDTVLRPSTQPAIEEIIQNSTVKIISFKEYPEQRFWRIHLKKMYLPSVFGAWRSLISRNGSSSAVQGNYKESKLHICLSLDAVNDAFQVGKIGEDDGVIVNMVPQHDRSSVPANIKFYRSLGAVDDQLKYIESFVLGDAHLRPKCSGSSTKRSLVVTWDDNMSWLRRQKGNQKASCEDIGNLAFQGPQDEIDTLKAMRFGSFQNR